MSDPTDGPTAPLIDTHAHLASRSFGADWRSSLDRAAEAGVVAVVAIGTDAADSPEVVAIAGQDPRVYAAVGIHPNDAAEAAPGDWDAIVALARSPRVVAIGETGLDRYWDRTPFPLQQEYFERHLDLAEELGLPAVIHSRECQADIIAQLQRRNRPIRGVQHSFTGTWDEAQTLLDLGLFLSFAGMITFENKSLDALRAVAAQVPGDRLLIETDSPYLTPHPFRGKKNEPARVALTAQALAKVRGESLESIAEATTSNARRLFGLGSA